MKLSKEELKELNIGEVLELSNETLQELKDGKISVSDLNERHFIGYEFSDNSWYMSDRESKDVVRKNIERLLYDNLCTFQELIDKLHDIPYREYAEDGKCRIYKHRTCLVNFLKNDDLIVDLNKNEKLMGPEATYIWNIIDSSEELSGFNYANLLESLLINDLILFQDVVDKYLNVGDLSSLVYSDDVFQELNKDGKLTVSDLKYLLDKITTSNEIVGLILSDSLIHRTLNEFVLDEKLVYKFNELLKNRYNDAWLEKYNLHKHTPLEFNIQDFFEGIEYEHKNHKNHKSDQEIQEILELIKLNRSLLKFELNQKQKLEIAEILRNSEFARSTLKSIVENNLQDQYKDFEQLKTLLTKEENKNLKNKFNF